MLGQQVQVLLGVRGALADCFKGESGNIRQVQVVSRGKEGLISRNRVGVALQLILNVDQYAFRVAAGGGHAQAAEE